MQQIRTRLDKIDHGVKQHLGCLRCFETLFRCTLPWQQDVYYVIYFRLVVYIAICTIYTLIPILSAGGIFFIYYHLTGVYENIYQLLKVVRVCIVLIDFTQKCLQLPENCPRPMAIMPTRQYLREEVS